MPLLTIRFDARGAPDEVGIATAILDADGHRIWEGATTLKEPTDVGLRPGSYLIRARLPSGDDATAQVRVDGDTTVVLHLHTPTDAVVAPAYYLKRAPRSSPQMSLSSSDLLLWVRTDDAWKGEAITLDRGTTTDFCDVRYANPSAARGVFAELRFWAPHDRHMQTWLAVRSQMFAIPNGLTTAAIIEPRGSGTFAVGVHNVRADADALLSYLSDGDFKSARTVGPRLIDVDGGLKDAHALLHGYMPNPAAAAIGGYYMIRAALDTLSEVQRADLYEWTRDFARSFPALPDAAVLLGWLALRNGERDTARDAFVEACRRGIAMYTVGLRYLVDGLRIVSGGGPAASALEWLIAYAPMVDWAAQTTALMIDKPRWTVPFEPFATECRLDLGPAREYRRNLFEPPGGDADESSFDFRRAALASVTSAPLIVPGALGITWSVILTKAAAQIVFELAGSDFSDDLVVLFEAIRDDPFAYQRRGRRFRYAILHRDDTVWRVPFLIDEGAETVTILTLDRIDPDTTPPTEAPREPARAGVS